jgi:hypothetical protein
MQKELSLNQYMVQLTEEWWTISAAEVGLVTVEGTWILFCPVYKRHSLHGWNLMFRVGDSVYKLKLDKREVGRPRGWKYSYHNPQLQVGM